MKNGKFLNLEVLNKIHITGEFILVLKSRLHLFWIHWRWIVTFSCCSVHHHHITKITIGKHMIFSNLRITIRFTRLKLIEWFGSIRIQSTKHRLWLVTIVHPKILVPRVIRYARCCLKKMVVDG